ncbi:MAG: divergent PAP2 family protein, partial [Clostridia bacterium]|nr:divergent PAP2 family protein [Clostridia bacterium]
GVFAVSAILTLVVCRDAMGVRRETEKQAKMLNDLLDTLREENPDRNLPTQRLNTFIGHTPLQIVVGAAIGISVAVILHWILG